jgi:hypothetical protein
MCVLVFSLNKSGLPPEQASKSGSDYDFVRGRQEGSEGVTTSRNERCLLKGSDEGV